MALTPLCWAASRDPAWAQATASVGCIGAEGDIAAIQKTIASLGPAGGVVSILPGICWVGTNETVQLASNVWLRGAGPGPGGTLFIRRGFSLQPVIMANNLGGMTNVGMSDFRIDEGDDKFVKALAASAPGSGGTTVQLSGSPMPAVLAGMAITDATNPGAIAGETYVTQVSSDGETLTLSGPVVGNGPATGDVLRFYPPNSTIDAEWVTGLTIKDIYMTRVSSRDSMTIQGDENFVIANNFVSVLNPDSRATGMILLTARTSATPPWNHNGYIVGNVLLNASFEMSATNTVVAYNVITPSYVTGIVSETVDPVSHIPFSEDNVFEHNIIHFSPLGLNKDGLVPGGMEIWDTNSLVTKNRAYGNGAQGIFIGGPGTRVSANQIWDNSRSLLSPSGSWSGLDVQTETAKHDVVTQNEVCNTAAPLQEGEAPTCLSAPNSGSQGYSFFVDSSVSGLVVSNDNTFYPGHAGVTGGSVPTSQQTNVAEGQVVATPCTLQGGQETCSTAVQWSTTGNVSGVSLLMSSSAAPGAWQKISSAAASSIVVPNLPEGIYVFAISSDQGMLASATVEAASPSLTFAATEAADLSPAPTLAPSGSEMSAVALAAPSPPALQESRTAGRALAGSAALKASPSQVSSAMPGPALRIASTPTEDGDRGPLPEVLHPSLRAIRTASEETAPLNTTDPVGPAAALQSEQLQNETSASAQSVAGPGSWPEHTLTAVGECSKRYVVVSASAVRAILRRTFGGDTGSELIAWRGGFLPSCGRILTISRADRGWVLETTAGTVMSERR